jgi:hypothetical protein
MGLIVPPAIKIEPKVWKYEASRICHQKSRRLFRLPVGVAGSFDDDNGRSGSIHALRAS